VKRKRQGNKKQRHIYLQIGIVFTDRHCLSTYSYNDEIFDFTGVEKSSTEINEHFCENKMT